MASLICGPSTGKSARPLRSGNAINVIDCIFAKGPPAKIVVDSVEKTGATNYQVVKSTMYMMRSGACSWALPIGTRVPLAPHVADEINGYAFYASGGKWFDKNGNKTSKYGK
jgi:hypothetical protein